MKSLLRVSLSLSSPTTPFRITRFNTSNYSFRYNPQNVQQFTRCMSIMSKYKPSEKLKEEQDEKNKKSKNVNITTEVPKAAPIPDVPITEPTIEERFGRDQITEIVQPKSPQILKIGIVGPPNVGKSTLINELAEYKVSAVSRKAQTTRTSVMGVYTYSNVQLVFMDTPGVIALENAKKIQREIVTSAWTTLRNVDLVLFIADAQNDIDHVLLDITYRLKQKENSGKDIVLVLNKADAVSPKRLAAIKEEFLSHGIFTENFVTSALRGTGVMDLRDFLMLKSQPGQWEHKPWTKTDQSDLKKATEIIREKIFRRVNQELPYIIQLENVGWTHLPNGDLRIDEEIYVRKQSQKVYRKTPN